jgi:hypothetical protein
VKHVYYSGVKNWWAQRRPRSSPDNVGDEPVTLKKKFTKTKLQANTRRLKNFADGVGRALRRAAKEAGRIARMHGTPVYVWKNGKAVAEKP